jgi:DNA-directed RNA polymerase specialized sigma24 family protein
VKSVIEGKMCLETEELLASIYEVTCKNKSEVSYVMFLSSHGIPHTEISKRTGISLRKVKSYLSEIK